MLPDGGAVVKGARELLQRLENSVLGDVPEKILIAMQTLQSALADTGTQPPEDVHLEGGMDGLQPFDAAPKTSSGPRATCKRSRPRR